MKPTTFVNGRFLLLLFALLITIGLVAWDYKQSPGYFQQSISDTVPEKKVQREKKIRDLDDVLDNLNDADSKIDEVKIKQEIAEALKNIDADKIKMQIENAMEQVDMAKIQADVKAALSKVDFDKIKVEINNAMKEIDMKKIQEEVEASLTKIDPMAIGWDEMKADLEKVKNIDMSELQSNLKNMQEELKNLEPELKKDLQKAKAEIEKSKTEIKAYQSFVNELDKDRLINKRDEYKIQHKNGIFEINGKKADKEVYKKYYRFLEKHEKFLIQKNKDDFKIDMD